MVDLWPQNIGKPGVVAPVAILKRQASLLGEKTNNIVEAEVVTAEDSWWASTTGLAYSFYLVAPALNRYRYLLFSIAHGIEMYPLDMMVDSDIYAEIIAANPTFPKGRYSTMLTIKTEDELQKVLGLIFNSAKTMRIIHSMMAQSGVDMTS